MGKVFIVVMEGGRYSGVLDILLVVSREKTKSLSCVTLFLFAQETFIRFLLIA